MAESNKSLQEPKGPAAEGARRGAAAVGETAQAMGNTLRHGAAATAEAVEQEVRAVSEVLHRSSEAGREAVRRSAEVLGTTIRQSVQAAADGQGRLIAGMAGQVEETSRRLADAIQTTAENMRTLLTLPNVPGRDLPDLQQTMHYWGDSVVQTNLRATQEVMRLVDPGVVLEAQQRFAQACLDTLLKGSTNVLDTARRVAEQTLRPLEEQLEQRRQPQAGEQHGQRHSRVADMMSREIYLASPDDTVQQAALVMRQKDTGVLPVSENDRIVGMLTARNLALRLVAEGRDPAKTKVREVMTVEGHYVFEDEDLHRAGDTMAEQKVRRLPVVNRDKRLVGIVSLGDLATESQSPWLAARALGGVSRENGAA